MVPSRVQTEALLLSCFNKLKNCTRDWVRSSKTLMDLVLSYFLEFFFFLKIPIRVILLENLTLTSRGLPFNPGNRWALQMSFRVTSAPDSSASSTTFCNVSSQLSRYGLYIPWTCHSRLTHSLVSRQFEFFLSDCNFNFRHHLQIRIYSILHGRHFFLLLSFQDVHGIFD